MTRIMLVADSGAAADVASGRLLRVPGLGAVRELLLNGFGDRAAALRRQVAAAGYLAGLRRYGTEYPDGAPWTALEAICAAPQLRGLRELRLGVKYVGPELTRWPSVLAAATFAPSLRRVHTDSFAAPQWVAAMSGPNAFPNLRELECFSASDAWAPPDGDRHEGWSGLFASCGLRRLRKLTVSAEYLADFARSPMARRVRDLTIAPGDPPPGAWDVLTGRAAPPTRLTLRHAVGPDGFAAIARSGWLRRARELGFGSDGDLEPDWDTPAGPGDAARALFAGPGALPRLKSLRLGGPGQLAGLGEWPGLGSIRRLVVGNDCGGWAAPESLAGVVGSALTELGEVGCWSDADLDGLAAFLAASRVTRLTLFVEEGHRVSPNTVTVAGLARFVASAGFARLRRLTLAVYARYELRDAVAKLFADPGVAPNLCELRLNMLAWHRAGANAVIARLRARFGPDCGPL